MNLVARIFEFGMLFSFLWHRQLSPHPSENPNPLMKKSKSLRSALHDPTTGFTRKHWGGRRFWAAKITDNYKHILGFRLVIIVRSKNNRSAKDAAKSNSNCSLSLISNHLIIKNFRFPHFFSCFCDITVQCTANIAKKGSERNHWFQNVHNAKLFANAKTLNGK